MDINELPVGSHPKCIEYNLFPTRWQHFLWRNWGIVPAERLANILGCSADCLRSEATALGLQANPFVHPKWLTHSYLTLIRNNWQLLDYEQLLQLLDWTPEKMAYSLKEEDFLFHKLGNLKPDCPKLKYEPLTEAQRQATAALRTRLLEVVPADEMDYIEKPFAFSEQYAAQKSVAARSDFEFNFIHSYAASCGDVLGNAASLDPVPENLLEQYASMGIQGVWLHAIMYLLCPIPGAEEYSAGHEERVANLKCIVERCARYGIKVYLYLNEPRSMPDSFYDKKPSWRGIRHGDRNLWHNCTCRTREPLEWLESAMKQLFAEVKGLGGAFCITESENPTHCHSHCQSRSCPACSQVPPEKIIVDVICAMERGMHAAAPEARMIAYDWAWERGGGDNDNASFKKAIISLLPKSVCINSVSEWGKITEVGGIKNYLVDYSISQVGPSQESLEVWKFAQERGMKVSAKVQLNNSWELSAVPYVPVPYLVQEHLDNLKRAGVNGLMLSWTLGGYPGGNLELLRATPEEIACSKYHAEVADIICQAEKKFSDAYRQFPFSCEVLYTSPTNYGPMNLLYRNPTGYKATMVGFPYDDLESWRDIYPADIFEGQFRLMTEQWREGLLLLEQAKSQLLEEEMGSYNELWTMSYASYSHLRSTYLQIGFIRARERNAAAEMRNCAREELALTKELYQIVRRDSRIGFEASNHYYYTLNDLREKMLNCLEIISSLEG